MIRYLTFSIQLNIQLIPNLSVHVPKYAPKNMSCNGIEIVPSFERALNSPLVSAFVEGSRQMCMLLPCVKLIPISFGESVAIKICPAKYLSSIFEACNEPQQPNIHMGISKNLAFYGLNPSPFSGREGYKEFLEMPILLLLPNMRIAFILFLSIREILVDLLLYPHPPRKPTRRCSLQVKVLINVFWITLLGMAGKIFNRDCT